jgi:hypothetical protein
VYGYVLDQFFHSIDVVDVAVFVVKDQVAGVSETVFIEKVFRLFRLLQISQHRIRIFHAKFSNLICVTKFACFGVDDLIELKIDLKHGFRKIDDCF